MINVLCGIFPGDDSGETFENYAVKTNWVALRQQLLHQYHIPGQTTTATDDSPDSVSKVCYTFI